MTHVPANEYLYVIIRIPNNVVVIVVFKNIK